MDYELKNKIEAARQKYGNERVMVCPEEVVNAIIRKEYDSLTECTAQTKQDIVNFFMGSASVAPRCTAEYNTDYRQAVAYVLLRNKNTGEIYTTYRVGGDPRLVGMHSIGTGGHISPADTHFVSYTKDASTFYTVLITGAQRELLEELKADTLVSVEDVVGLIKMSESEVDRVHFGIVMLVDVDPEVTTLKIQEPEKLQGKWMSVQDILSVDDEGKMESWSHVVIQNLFRYEEDDDGEDNEGEDNA